MSSTSRSIRFYRGQMAAPLRGKRSEKFEKYRTKYEKGLILAVSNVCPADLYSRACGHSTHHRSSLLSDSIQHTPPKMLNFIDLYFQQCSVVCCIQSILLCYCSQCQHNQVHFAQIFQSTLVIREDVDLILIHKCGTIL